MARLKFLIFLKSLVGRHGSGLTGRLLAQVRVEARRLFALAGSTPLGEVRLQQNGISSCTRSCSPVLDVLEAVTV